MREQNVVVAVVQAGPGRFLIVFNRRWGGFSFPMTVLPDGENPTGPLAVQALARDLRCSLPNATASQFARVRLVGPSQRTGEDTLYQFFLFTVDPGQPLDLSAVPVWSERQRPTIAPAADLLTRTDVTWTVPALVREFVENQEAALAVVTRAGDDGPEFLLVHNDRFDGYFFPVRRVRSDAAAGPTAVGAVRTDTGYTGDAVPEYLGEALAVQHSPRFGVDRQYRFHVCAVTLPDVDLHRPGGPLEQALRGRDFVWLSAAQLSRPPVVLSPTMAHVRATVVGLTPPTPPGPLPPSEGGLALIERTVGDRRERLVRWNDNWGAFFLVGGHRLGSETFRECVVREVGEELGLTPAECPVAATPTHRRQYRAVSGSTGQLTAYTMEVFAAVPTDAARARIENASAGAPPVAWVSDDEIRDLETNDGRPISPTVGLLV